MATFKEALKIMGKFAGEVGVPIIEQHRKNREIAKKGMERIPIADKYSFDDIWHSSSTGNGKVNNV